MGAIDYNNAGIELYTLALRRNLLGHSTKTPNKTYDSSLLKAWI